MSLDVAEVRPEQGIRSFIKQQTRVSTLVGSMGLTALVTLFAGTALTITVGGWVPSNRVASGLTSRAEGLVLSISLALGIAAVATGWRSYRRMPNKASRNAAVGGVALGAQAAVLALLGLWFRTGDVEVFARNFFEFRIVAREWPRFVRAALNTIVLALGGEAIGIVLGLVLSMFAMSARAVVRAPARTYINFLRGTPLFWQLQFGFFGIVLGLRLPLSPYQVAILIIGLNAAAYSAEVFRAGIQSIERGQFEAARSLGMSRSRAMRHVILPQAVRRVIPPLTNEFVILIKDTALVSILGLTLAEKELLGVGRDLYAATFNATPFLASAAGYLVVTLPLIRAVSSLEKRLRSGLVTVGA